MNDSWTRWRDHPVVPSDYNDIAGLVAAAKNARNRIVEFEWAFTKEDLTCLRHAVYEWGSGCTGRYKTFDARVLKAINEALGEHRSAFILKEPKGAEQVVANVSSSTDLERYQLRGHTTFDIVFGYGRAGVGHPVTGSVHLISTAKETLANSVGMLGWDLLRLKENRYQPVINGLFGLPMNHGITGIPLPAGPAINVTVHFRGPFSAADGGGCRCLFDDQITKERGVYIWTLNVEGQDLPWYVGQTRVGFGARMAQHLSSMLSGEYATYDAAALLRGEHVLAEGAVHDFWPNKIPIVLREYEKLMPNILLLIRSVRFHFASLDGDTHLFNRVEGMVGRYFKNHADSSLRQLISPGLKLPAAIPFDKPIRLVISSEAPIAGLPAELAE